MGAAEIEVVDGRKNSATVVGKCRWIGVVVKFALEWSDDADANWHNDQYSNAASFLRQDLVPEIRY